jgi:DNA-binding NarL/FixJ family response regulator
MPKFLVVDDHPLFREALSSSIRQAFNEATVLEAGSLQRTLEAITENADIDLVLLDLNLPGTSGVHGLLTLRTKFPKLPVLIVSANDDRRVVAEALRYGAVGYLPKSVPKTMLERAITETLKGGVFLPPDHQGIANEAFATGAGENDLAKQLANLTPQQVRVLRMLSEGKLNKQIAFELNIGETTVKAHVSAILRKLKVFSRTQAVIKMRNIQLENLVSSGEAGTDSRL